MSFYTVIVHMLLNGRFIILYGKCYLDVSKNRIPQFHHNTSDTNSSNPIQIPYTAMPSITTRTKSD
jgi:hypothetical protein